MHRVHWTLSRVSERSSITRSIEWETTRRVGHVRMGWGLGGNVCENYGESAWESGQRG